MFVRAVELAGLTVALGAIAINTARTEDIRRIHYFDRVIDGDTGDGNWGWIGCSSCQNNLARAWLIVILKALIAQEPEQ